MKIKNWVAGILIGLIALILLAVLTLTRLIDPNRFRGQIESAVQEATGQPFAIRGNLDITWFPWLAVRTGAAELGSPPLAQWQSARVGVRLLPLIKGQMVIDRVRFEGLKVHLHRTPDGRANWDTLLANQSKEPTKPRSTPQIGGLEIRNGALDYIDEKSGTQIRVSNWTLDVGAWKEGKSVPIGTQLTVERGPQRVQLDFETEVQLAGGMQRIEARDTGLSGKASLGAPREQGIAFDAELPQVSVTLEPLSIAAPDWKLKLADAELAGSLTAEKARARGPLSIKIPSTREFLSTLGIDAPVPKDRKALGPLTLTTSWAFVEGAIALKPITLQLDETSFTGEVVRSNGPEATWSFALRGDRIDLGRYLITEDTSDEPFELPTEALRALRAQGTLAFDQAHFANAQLKNARIRLVMADGKVRTTAGVQQGSAQQNSAQQNSAHMP